MTEQVNKNPRFSGKVQDGLGNDIGKIAVWDNISDNERAPLFVGKIEVGGIKYKISLWKFEPKAK
jgi:hypothetical protein